MSYRTNEEDGKIMNTIAHLQEPNALNVLLASQYFINYRKGYEDPFMETEFALKWRQRYLSPWVHYTLSLIVIMNLFYVVVDDLYTCDDMLSYPILCWYNDVPTLGIVGEVFLIFFIGIGLVMEICYKQKLILKSPWLLFTIFAFVMTLITFMGDHVVFAIFGDRDVSRWFWFIRACFRPVFVLNVFHRSREIFYRMGVVVPKVTIVLSVGFMFLVMFAFFARVLVIDVGFPGNDFGIPGNGFDSMASSISTLFWWATGNNGPEPGNQVGRPGFKDGKFWAYFFVFFTIFEVFYVFQVVTASVFEVYGGLSDDHKRKCDRVKERSALKMFRLLSVKSGEKTIVLKETLDSLYAISYDMGRVFESIHTHPSDGVGFQFEEFAKEIELYMTYKEPESAQCDDEATPWERMRFFMRKMVASIWWSVVLSIFDVINLVLLIINVEEAVSVGTFTVVTALHLTVLILYIVDLIVSLIGFGLVDFLRCVNGYVTARGVITLFCLGMFVHHVHLTSWNGPSRAILSSAMLFVAVASVQLLRVITYIPACNIMVTIMVKLIPSLADLGLASICIMYSWSVLGVMISGGEFTMTNPQVVAFDSGPDGPAYYTCNFNGVMIGVYTLFWTIYNNNIANFVGGLKAAGGTMAVVHFMIFYVYAVFILGNIILSILVDTYSDMKAELLEERAKRKHAEVAPCEAKPVLISESSSSSLAKTR